jgi:serine phosphatase RsbU (regulator of sigma subunit)
LRTIAPVAVLATIVTVDVALAPRISISGSYAIAAVIAATVTSVRMTAVVAVLALVLAAVSGSWNDNWGTLDWQIRLGLTASLAVLAVVAAAIRARRERALSRMTAIAEVAQKALLRTLPKAVDRLELAARYVSAAQDAQIGGDLYEVANTPYGVRVVVGDVRGKGLDAVELAAVVLGAFRRSAATAPSLGCVAIEVDEVVARVVGDEDFVTAVLAEFHPDDTVTLVNCGHPPPLVVAPGPSIREAATGEPQLPLGMGTAGRASTISLPPGHRMLLYTDGLIETRDSAGRFFPLAEQADALSRTSVDAAVDTLLRRLNDHARHQLRDDVAVILASPQRSTA